MPTNDDQAKYVDAPYDGRAQSVDDDGFINPLQYKPKIVAKTSAHTVEATESGTLFTTEGATGSVEFTLPAAGDGPWIFDFYCAEDQEMKVTAAAVNTMVTHNNVAADGISITTNSEHVGASVRVFSSGGSVVYVQAMLGGSTLTVVDA